MTATPAVTRELVDTNIFMYGIDTKSGDKQSLAQSLIERLTQNDLLAISVQTLNEFYAVATRERQGHLPHELALEAVQAMVQSSVVLPLTATASLTAMNAVERYQFSFWDALLWAVAKENGISRIHSEDFQHGCEIEGVTFNNPFVVAQS